MNVLSNDWGPFARTLASVLRQLQEDQFLVLAVKQSNRYIQFAAQGSFGMRAETASNYFLSETEQLNDTQVAELLEAGWRAPTRNPQESTPENDPDGSPNFFIDIRKPGNFTKVSKKAVAALVGILGVPHPGFLEYQSFDAEGNAILLPDLGLKLAETRSTNDLDPLPTRVLSTLRALTGIADLDFDADGDIGLNYGEVTVFVRTVGSPPRVHVFSPLLSDVEETPELLAQLNMLNTGRAHMHFYLRGTVVFAVAEVPAEPYVPDTLSILLQDFCVTVEAAHEMLAAELGSPEHRHVTARPALMH